MKLVWVLYWKPESESVSAMRAATTLTRTCSAAAGMSSTVVGVCLGATSVGQLVRGSRVYNDTKQESYPHRAPTAV